MRYLKVKIALMIFDEYATLKYKCDIRNFGAQGYYVSPVGFNQATIQKYIQELEKAEIILYFQF